MKDQCFFQTFRIGLSGLEFDTVRGRQTAKRLEAPCELPKNACGPNGEVTSNRMDKLPSGSGFSPSGSSTPSSCFFPQRISLGTDARRRRCCESNGISIMVKTLIQVAHTDFEFLTRAQSW